MVSSIYSPLRGDGREFRLLVLEPSPDRLAPLQCTLNQASFDDDDLEYTALSYTWGDALVTAPISVNGLETQVTLNLETALRHIRESAHIIVLWVDALCINQADVSEKNHQVQIMREIFSGAKLVIAWLGSASEDSDLAMELLATGMAAWMESEGSQNDSIQEDGVDYTVKSSSDLKDEPSDQGPVGEEDLNFASRLSENMGLQLPDSETGINPGDGSFIFEVHDEDRNKYHATDQISMSPSSRSSSSSLNVWYFIDRFEKLPLREALAMTRLLTRSWWSRIWVVQEVLLAQRVVFKCGDAEVPGERMAGTNFHTWIPLLRHVDRPSLFHCVEALELLDEITTRHEDQNSTTYLVRYSKREATRPHDHIYGLFGIIPKDEQMLLGAPDYACRVEDLLINVMTKLMVEYNSLALLDAAAARLPATTSSKNIDLPSWVPDWTQPPLLGNGTMLDWSDPFPEVDAEFHISEDSKELTFKCVEVGRIESVKPVPALTKGKMPIWEDASETTNEQRSPPLRGSIIALFISNGATKVESFERAQGFEFVAALFQELEEYRISLGRDESGEVHDKADYLKGFLECIDDSRNGRTDEEILENIFSVQAAHSFVEWYHGQSTADFQRFYKRYSLMRPLRQNSFLFKTCKGVSGVTLSANVAPGDVICMVPGGETPLLLREVQSSKHKLIGACDPIAGMVEEMLAQVEEQGDLIKDVFTLI